ncbi:unnamed protein product [Rhizophagus irregularis]|nr:unnamed protein product [Rhizophagus irregularis]
MKCKYCNSTRYSERYCENCIREHLRGEFSKWSSGDETVDKFIQYNQLQASVPPFILEWISPDQFENITYLTDGGFSKIHCAKWKRGPIMDWDEEKRQFVYEGTVDIVLKSLNEFSERFYDEVNNYFKIKSGNLVKCYGITKFPNSDNYVMVMNYYKEGTLYDYLQSHQSRINLKDKIYFIYRICFALYRIHSNDYVHRDLHSKNILLLTNRCLISDLGLCGPAENNLAGAYGVLPYMAPELIDKKQYSKASDIYSLGMLMWEIFAERPPFHDQPHNMDLLLGIVDGRRPQMLPEIPDNFQQLIKKCWTEDAKKRPEIEKIYGIVNKEFIKIYENDEMMLKYDNKRATESLEIPKSPSTYHTSSASGMPPIESLTINNYTFISNKNCTYCTNSSLRHGRENDNEKVMYDATNKSSNGNYLSFSFLLLKKKMTKKVQQTRFNSHFIFKISRTSKFYSS